MSHPVALRLLAFAALAVPLGVLGCAPGAGGFTVTTEDDDVPYPDDDASDDDASDDDASDDDSAPTDDDSAPTDDDSAPTDDDSTPDTSEWDGALLRILSPESGSFQPLGQPVELEAEVVSPAGDTLDFDDIHWTTDQSASWSFDGAEGTSDDLPVGEHVITAQAELPNGDRVAYAVGGVLVQHELAGVYSGTFGLTITATINGVPLSASCLGSTSFSVDAWGEELEGDATCTIDVFGLFTQDIAFGVDGEVDPNDGHVDGTLGLVIWTFELPTDYEGDLSADGTFAAGFSQDIFGVGVEGDIEATRVALTPG